MRFTIDKGALLSHIQHLQSVVPVKTVTQILTNFLLEADSEQGLITITTTDLDITVVVSINASVSEGGKLAVNARNLTDIINSLEDKPINFFLEEDFLRIRCGRSKFSLLSADPIEFPNIPDIKFGESALNFPAQLFAKMVDIASIAVLNETTRPIFTGINWEIMPDKQKMSSTDGKKIVEIIKEHSIRIDEPIAHVIPTKGLFFLGKVIEGESEIKVQFDTNRIVFQYKNYLLISQIIAGKFPDYSKVFLVDNPNELTIDKNALKQAVRRVSLLSTEEFYRIKFDISPENFVLSSVNSEMGDATDVIEDHSYSGPPFTIAFNYKYILSLLNVLESDKVKMTFGVPENGFVNTQVIIYNQPEPEDYHPIFLLMPLRLK